LKHLKEPVVIVTSGTDNSLSASMEMMTYLADNKIKGKLLHGTKTEIARDLEYILKAVETRNQLKSMKLGMIGKPSDWLISTNVDYSIIKDKLGIEVIDISMDELLSEISKGFYEENDQTKELLNRDFNKSEIEKALHIYGAFSRLVEKYKLDGFSVRCFDLLTSVKNTGCLGLALLNQEGIYSGCEGDLPSLISMAILSKLSNKPIFQSNPSRINKSNNEIIFAHCTLPLNMPEKYNLDTHFESGIGVAVAGDIPKGKATIFKSNSTLERYFISEGDILESLHEDNLCRSQIRIAAKEGVDKFLNTPVGNHYLICLGDYTNHLKEFFEII
jgi:L-fucose isomerase-like protein